MLVGPTGLLGTPIPLSFLRTWELASSLLLLQCLASREPRALTRESAIVSLLRANGLIEYESENSARLDG